MAKLVDAEALKKEIERIAIEVLNRHNCWSITWDEFCERITPLIDSMPDLSEKANLVNKYTVKSHINKAIEGLITANTILTEEYYPEEKE